MEDYDLLLRAGVRSISTNVEQRLEQQQNPKSFIVSNNYPNPFNGGTTLKIEVLRPNYYTVQIVNIRGRIVKNILLSRYLSGPQELFWDGKDDVGNDVPSGVYFAHITSGDQMLQIKLSLIR